MELFWQDAETNEYNDGTGLDLDDVWDEPSVLDAESLKLAVLHHIALWALEQDISMDTVVGFTFDHDGDEIEIEAKPGDWTWLDEVCLIVEFIKGNKHYCPDNAIFARIKDIGWKFFDFDTDLQTAEDEYYQEFDGDYKEFARDWMDNVGESIAEHLEYHFDYESYGESLVEDYDRIEFASEEFLFSR
ncbi:ArdA-like antirestriction protein [Streptomyces phage RosePharie]|nr:ArdA-like antirestriction protein [Streptomyces phage RosePharie]